MSEDPRAGPGRAAGPRKGDKVAPAADRGARPAPTIMSAPSRPQLVPSRPRPSAAAEKRVGGAMAMLRKLVDDAKTAGGKLATGLALPRLKFSPLLWSFIG